MPKRNRMKLKDFKDYVRGKDSHYDAEDTSRWSSKPRKVQEKLAHFLGGSDVEIELGSILKRLMQLKRQHGKKYKKLWLEMNDVEIDEFGHTERQLQLWGERNETQEETETRMRRYLSLRITEYRNEKARGDYWNSREGQKELAFLLLFREREGLR